MKDPVSYPINNLAVYYFMLDRKPDKAIGYYQRLLNVNDTPTEELEIRLSIIYEQKREYRKSIKILQSALRTSTNNNYALLTL